MAAPTLVTSGYSNWGVGTAGTPGSAKTSTALTCSAGDVLVILGVTDDSAATLNTPTGGTGLTWTLQKSSTVANHTPVYAWTTTVGSAQTVTVSITSNDTIAPYWGFAWFQYSGSNGVGASAINSPGTNTTPTVSVTTTGANSALCVVNGDWAAVFSTPFTETASSGTTTSVVAQTDGNVGQTTNGAQYTSWVWYIADAGAAGAKTTGMSSPVGQTPTTAVVEVLGASASTPATVTGVLATATVAAPAGTVGIFTTVTPATDITTAGWTFTGGATASAVMGEAVASDAEYATSPTAPTSSVLEVKFAAVANPGTTSGHQFSYRIATANASSSTVIAALYQGTTLIATETRTSVPSTFTTYTMSLTTGQAATITDYTDLRLRLTATAS